MLVSSLKIGDKIRYKDFDIFITGLDDQLHDFEISHTRYHRFVTYRVYSTGLFPEYLFWSAYMFWNPEEDDFFDCLGDSLFEKYL